MADDFEAEIIRIGSDAEATGENVADFSKGDVLVLDVKPNDALLKKTEPDYSCGLHSTLFAILRSPSLKKIYLDSIRKDPQFYYFLVKCGHDAKCYKIPRNSLELAKIAQPKLFPDENIDIVAIGYSLLVVTYAEMGYVEVSSYQTHGFETDFFLHKPHLHLGLKTDATANPDGSITLQSTEKTALLLPDGSILVDDQPLKGIFIVLFAAYEVKAEDVGGHATSAFYDAEMMSWRYFDDCHEDGGEFSFVDKCPLTFTCFSEIVGICEDEVAK
jgi:hypothetical protein